MPRRTKAFGEWMFWYRQSHMQGYYGVGFLQGLQFGLKLKGMEARVAELLPMGMHSGA